MWLPQQNYCWSNFLKTANKFFTRMSLSLLTRMILLCFDEMCERKLKWTWKLCVWLNYFNEVNLSLVFTKIQNWLFHTFSALNRMIYSYGNFFTLPQNRQRALFFRFFSKSAKLCNFNIPYCILRSIRCICRHFQQNFDVVGTFRLPAASFFAAAPQKWLILAILRHFPLLLVVRLVSKKSGIFASLSKSFYTP